MNRDINFPVVYNLRVIYKGSPEDGYKKIGNLLTDLSINVTEKSHKPSGKGNLIRFIFNITLYSKDQMDVLYSNLQTIEAIKWAV